MPESTSRRVSMGVSVWEHFTIADGLPDMRVECIHATAGGSVWIGTHDRGVVRYSGAGFASYTRAEGLPGSRVFALAEDSRGRLWVGTDHGVCYQKAERFAVVPGGEHAVLWGRCVDRSGRVWFGLERQPGSAAAALCCHEDSAELVHLGDSASESGEPIHALACDALGRVWAGGEHLYRQCGDRKFERVAGPEQPMGTISSLLWHDTDGLWVAAETGIYELRASEWRTLCPAARPGAVSLYCAPSGQVWATLYQGGLLAWQGDGFDQVADMGAVLRGGLCEDAVGRLWVGTYGMGVYYCDRERLRLWPLGDGEVEQPIYALAVAPGRVWAGTGKGPVHITTSAAAAVDHEVRLTDRRATALLSATDGLVWVGTEAGYLFALRQCAVVLCAPLGEIRGFSVSALAEDASGRIWFASRHGRAFGWWEAGAIRCFGAEGSADRPGWVGALCADRQGRVWLGLARAERGAVLWCWDNGGFRVVPEAGDSPVSALVEVEDGLLAVGTSDGVLLLRADHVAERLTQREGLSCDVVTALARGRGGRLLIGTQGGGLCQYDGHVIQNLQVPGRVGANVVNAVCEDDEGVIWIGTAGGLVRYAPRWSVPAVGIEGVTTDRTYRPEAQVEVAAPAGRARFEFRGVSPHEPAEYLVYRHRLVGHAAAWQCTHERYAEYEGLRPGDCVFEVQAVDRDLRYSPVARLELRIVEDPRVAALTAVLSSEGAKGEFIGESASLRRVLQQLREVASTELTVLVTGETGTGKGLAARAIHQLSARRHGPFIHVNCGGLQAQLIESDLFGHERGAFTGAVARRLGKFELADGGTIFLDEIGDLSADCQTRLLHVLQERVIERVGSQKSVSVDVRVIAATNRDLARAVRQNQFRADLFYRLNVFPVVLPPLRDRREDVPLLAQHFVRQFSAHLHRPPPVLTDAAMVRLLEYSWPGNVRELEHTIQRAVILSDSTSIGPEHIVLGPMPPAQQQEQNLEILPLEEFERRYLQRVLEHTGGVIHGRRGAALLLGVKPTTLRSRLQRLGLR